MRPRPPVLPGEIYRDNDGRTGGKGTRYVQVVVVDGQRAHVQRVSKSGGVWTHDEHFPSTRIRLGAFHSRAQTGFTLVESPWPAHRITLEVTGGTSLLIQRLIYAIEVEAQEFSAEFARIEISADGSRVLDINGRRRLLSDVMADADA